MVRKRSYREELKQGLGDLIQSLELDERQRKMLHSRWLDQVLWMEGAADRARERYYVLRMTILVGGLLTPALVSLRLGGEMAEAVSWLAFGASLATAISAACEEFFHYGDRWRHYRQTVEALKTEGWQFFQLAGSYRGARSRTHSEAYPRFASRVEEIIQRDVGVYITELTREQDREKEQPTSGAAGNGQAALAMPGVKVIDAGADGT